MAAAERGEGAGCSVIAGVTVIVDDRVGNLPFSGVCCLVPVVVMVVSGMSIIVAGSLLCVEFAPNWQATRSNDRHKPGTIWINNLPKAVI